MPNVTKVNSGKGLVSFSRKELADLDLLKWVRADSKGYGKRDFISVQPIEKAAASVYKEKYPSIQIKIAEKCFLNDDGSVDVVLRVAQDVSDGYYKKHPTKMNFLGDVRSKEDWLETDFHEEMDNRKIQSGLFLPIEFLEENIRSLSDDEKRIIHAELGKENVDTFLEDLRLTLLETTPSLEKLAEERQQEEEDEDDSNCVL